MPYFSLEPDADPETNEELFHESSAYDNAQADFDFESATKSVQLVRDVLLSRGFKSVTCSYRGGHDEGFAEFSDASLGGRGSVYREKLSGQLADTPLAEHAMKLAEDHPECLTDFRRQQIEEMEPAQRVLEVLDDFALELASVLLARPSFASGTGDHS